MCGFVSGPPRLRPGIAELTLLANVAVQRVRCSTHSEMSQILHSELPRVAVLSMGARRRRSRRECDYKKIMSSNKHSFGTTTGTLKAGIGS